MLWTRPSQVYQEKRYIFSPGANSTLYPIRHGNALHPPPVSTPAYAYRRIVSILWRNLALSPPEQAGDQRFLRAIVGILLIADIAQIWVRLRLRPESKGPSNFVVCPVARVSWRLSVQWGGTNLGISTRWRWRYLSYPLWYFMYSYCGTNLGSAIWYLINQPDAKAPSRFSIARILLQHRAPILAIQCRRRQSIPCLLPGTIYTSLCRKTPFTRQ